VAGLLLAGPVYTLEPPRLPTDSVPPVSYLAANEFEAVSFIEDGTNAATAPSEPSVRNEEQAAQLFGMETEPVATGGLLEKWPPRRGRDGSRFRGGCAMPCKWDLPCRRAKTDRHKREGRRAKRPGTCGPDQQSCGPRHQPGQ